MPTINLRVTKQPGGSSQPLKEESLIQFLKKQGQFVGAFEIGKATKEEHYHFVLDTKKTKHNVINQFKSAFPECKGNKGYSAQLADDRERSIQYIMKGASKDVMPVIVHDDFELDHAALHAAYHVEAEARSKERKDRKRRIVDVVYEKYTAEHGDGPLTSPGKRLSRMIIQEQTKRMCINWNSGQQALSAITAKLNGEKEVDRLADMLLANRK